MKKLLYYIPVLGFLGLLLTDETKIEWNWKTKLIYSIQFAFIVILITWLIDRH